MHILCSSTSAIPPISENRRQLMQYKHKDTCNNQTLPHPTTPLVTLTQRQHRKTPQQETRELQATYVLRALSWDFWVHLRFYFVNLNVYFNLLYQLYLLTIISLRHSSECQCHLQAVHTKLIVMYSKVDYIREFNNLQYILLLIPVSVSIKYVNFLM